MDSDLMMLMMMSGQGGMGQIHLCSQCSWTVTPPATTTAPSSSKSALMPESTAQLTLPISSSQLRPPKSSTVLVPLMQPPAPPQWRMLMIHHEEQEIRHVRSPPPLNDGRSRYGQHELNAPTSSHEGRWSWRQQDAHAHDDARWQHGRHEPTLDDEPPRVKTKKSKNQKKLKM